MTQWNAERARLTQEELSDLRRRINGSDAGPWAPDYQTAWRAGGRFIANRLLDEIEALAADRCAARDERNQFDRWNRESRALLRAAEAELRLAREVVEAAKEAEYGFDSKGWMDNLKNKVHAYDAHVAKESK